MSANRLGRNPFGKKGAPRAPEAGPVGAALGAKPRAEEASSAHPLVRLADWALVQVPADAALTALKVALRVKDRLQR